MSLLLGFYIEKKIKAILLLVCSGKIWYTQNRIFAFGNIRNQPNNISDFQNFVVPSEFLKIIKYYRFAKIWQRMKKNLVQTATEVLKPETKVSGVVPAQSQNI